MQHALRHLGVEHPRYCGLFSSIQMLKRPVLSRTGRSKYLSAGPCFVAHPFVPLTYLSLNLLSETTLWTRDQLLHIRQKSREIQARRAGSEDRLARPGRLHGQSKLLLNSCPAGHCIQGQHIPSLRTSLDPDVPTLGDETLPALRKSIGACTVRYTCGTVRKDLMPRS